MPITVSCPGCNSNLTAPPAAAGRVVKCPKCQAKMLIPAKEAAEDFEVVAEDDFEVVDDAPPPAKPKSAAMRSPRDAARAEGIEENDFEVVDDDAPPAKSKSAAARSPRADDELPRKKRKIVDDNDNDDDEEDDRPRKKGKKKPPPKSKLPIYIGGGVLLVILLCVGGYMIFSGGSKKVKTDAADSWVRFSAPDGSFHVSFPATPTSPDDLDIAEMVGQSREEAAKMIAAAKAMGITADSWMSTEGNRWYVIQMVKFVKEVTDAAKIEEMLRSENRKQYEKNGKILGEESIEIGGKSVKCFRIKPNNGKTYITAFFILGDRGYDFTIIDDNDVTSSDANAKKFLDSFRSGRPVAADPSKAGPKAKPRGR